MYYLSPLVLRPLQHLCYTQYYMKTSTIQFRCSPEEYEALSKSAAERGVKLSALIRERVLSPNSGSIETPSGSSIQVPGVPEKIEGIKTSLLLEVYRTFEGVHPDWVKLAEALGDDFLDRIAAKAGRSSAAKWAVYILLRVFPEVPARVPTPPPDFDHLS